MKQAISQGEILPASLDSDHEQWRSSRQAIIHSLDISAANSACARKVIAGFQRGLYAGNVDLHVGDVSEWISKELESRAAMNDGQNNETFLSHALLDLPMAETHLERVASALHVDGVLTVFNPSVTQIIDCVKIIKEDRLPLALDQVIELGPSMTGGREWDVRAMVPRAMVKDRDDQKNESDILEGDAESSAHGIAEEKRDDEQEKVLAAQENHWKMICRPKVGGIVSGGGFLGVWRRMRYRTRGKPID